MARPMLSDEARATVEEALRAHVAPNARLTGISRLSGGACQQNLLLTLADGNGDPLPPHVLRADAATSLPMSLRRRQEEPVMRAAAAAGVPTPAPLALLESVPRPGRDAVLMPWVEGEAVGARIIASDSLAEARKDLPEALARALARIHSVTPDDHPELLPNAADDPVDVAMNGLRVLTEGLCAMRPALSLAVRWLEDHLPADRTPVLVHGDFRVGNFLVSPRGLEAVLDWEFAHWGAAGEDLGWIMVRDWRFSRPELPVGGLCGRETFLRAWENHAGRTIDRADVRFWEVYGNVRWAAGCHFQTMRVLAGGERNLELLAISRRAVEMEVEALRLIDRAT